jgi:hypothetical protein
VTGALVVAAALVWQSAYAGFTDTTTALPAGVGSGTVAVTNEVEGVAALTVPALRPGLSFTECIVVTSTGSAPAQVRLYVKDRGSTVTGLTSKITFKVTAGTGGGVNDDCAGFVPYGTTVSTTLSSFPSTYDSGVLPWDTAGGAAPEKRTYRLTWSLAGDTSTSAKGSSARVTLAWEAQQR